MALHAASTAKTSIALLAVGGMLAAMPLSAAVAGTGGTAKAHSPAASAPTPKLGAGGRVIVVMRGQTGSAPLRGATSASAATARSEQRDVVSAIRSSGGTVRSTYTLVNAVAATVTPAQASALAARSDVAEVIPDARIKAPDATTEAGDPDVDASAGVAPAPNTCPTDPSQVQLEPEALEATEADSDQPGAVTARSLGYDGTGVTVAYMAEGIDINNPDFMRDGKSVFTDYQDFTGDGTDAPTDGAEAFLDASAIAAQGNETYDVSHFSKLPLSQQCLIKVEGEAPGVNMVGLKVFGNGFSTTSGFLDAIQYAVTTDKVDVLNQSFGSNPIPDTSEDVIKAADEAAVAAGTTVTVSSGDAGITNTIGSPADDPAVISVGATTTYRFDLQTGYAAARFPGITGWSDDNISSLSSAGFTANASTVNLVAPGELNFGLCSTDLDTYFGCADYAGDGIGLEASGGTSESAPIVAGIAALVIQSYREAHDGASPTPAAVKDILVSSADDVSAPAAQQGAGLVDAAKAVQLASSFSGGTGTGEGIRTTSTQLRAVTAPGATSSFTDTLTNEGSTPQTVQLTSRTLGAYSPVLTTAVKLDDTTSPKYVDFQGLPDNYAKVTFNVPAGASRLESSLAYVAASSAASARVRLTLVDPTGHEAAYSLPQGIGNYGHVEVAKPAAGTWTGYITSRTTAGGGTTGVVRVAAATASYKKFGTVSPSSLTLAPGASGKVTLKAASPATPGDTDGSLVITSTTPAGTDPIAGAPDALADRSTSTVPVVLRSLIPTGKHTFDQTLTGGNGRGEGDFYHYQINVAKGSPELNASVALGGSANNQFQAVLISPSGNATAFASNIVMTNSSSSGSGSRLVKGLQLHTLAPAAGKWTIELNFVPVVSGTVISSPFTVTTSETAVASTTSVPNSKKTVLAAGKKVTAYIKVTNTGTTPEAYFVDPRLTTQQNYALAAQTGADATAPITDNLPVYIVPTDSTKIAGIAKTTGDAPIEFDTEGPLGDPDVESSAGTTASVSYAAAPVSAGAWDIATSQVGPDGATGVAPEDVTTSFAVRTLGFDPSVKTTTGSLWDVSLDPSATFNPVTVPAGQTVVFAVKIDPTGKGLKKGVIFIDDADVVATSGSSFLSPNANQVVAVPYKYTVKAK